VTALRDGAATLNATIATTPPVGDAEVSTSTLTDSPSVAPLADVVEIGSMTGTIPADATDEAVTEDPEQIAEPTDPEPLDVKPAEVESLDVEPAEVEPLDVGFVDDDADVALEAPPADDEWDEAQAEQAEDTALEAEIRAGWEAARSEAADEIPEIGEPDDIGEPDEVVAIDGEAETSPAETAEWDDMDVEPVGLAERVRAAAAQDAAEASEPEDASTDDEPAASIESDHATVPDAGDTDTTADSDVEMDVDDTTDDEDAAGEDDEVDLDDEFWNPSSDPEESTRGSFYSRRSGRLPRLGADASRGAMSAALGMRLGHEED
jgi:hypothetical protein